MEAPDKTFVKELTVDTVSTLFRQMEHAFSLGLLVEVVQHEVVGSFCLADSKTFTLKLYTPIKK